MDENSTSEASTTVIDPEPSTSRVPSGAITAAVKGARERGHQVSHAHLRYLNQLPGDLGELLGRFRRKLLPELNLGQLSLLLRARYLVDIESFTKVAGQPFKVFELQEKIEQMLEETK